jgi:outer membrane lipoprotein-sorting protein
VSAQEILVKAGLAVGSPSVSYHEIRYQEDEGTIEVAEYWYLDERHRRGERRTVRDGRQSLVDGAIVNGEDVWWYRSVDGTVTAIHGRSGGPISVAAVAVGRDISSTLAMYGGDESCQIASLEREDVVVGRRTYVIRVVPAPQNCTRTDSMKTAMEEQARRKMSHTFWIDKQTFVSLRSEHREGDRLVAQTATQRLETGLVIPSSVFSYEAPEGATVQEVTTIADLCRYTGMGCQRP